ncbi:hypothetical protein L835_4935, partial [Mycobacteroides abscessus MAB_110811_1470]
MPIAKPEVQRPGPPRAQRPQPEQQQPAKPSTDATEALPAPG